MVATWQFWTADVRDNPYPIYREMRDREPVHWNGYEWVLTRHEDVQAMLLDGRTSSVRGFLEWLPEAEQSRYLPLIETNRGMMLLADPPDHTRLRGLVAQAFSARMIERMRPRISALVDELLAEVELGSEWDVIATLANPLPGLVIGDMLGVPAADQPTIKRWATDYATWLGQFGDDPEIRDRANQSVVEMSDYIRDAVAARRSEPRDDLLSALVFAEEQGDRLTEQELVSTVLLLLVAGNETTTNLIGNGLLTLARHPGSYRQLRDDPSLIRPAVEELLRFESPIQLTARRVVEPIELGEARLEPGQFVMTLIGAANRDPAQFDAPELLDLTRRPNRHIAFAHGIHFCLGAPLARAEGQLAIQAVVSRFPTLELVDERAEWIDNPVFRGLGRLRVVGG